MKDPRSPFADNAWRRMCGIKEVVKKPQVKLSIPEILKSQWSEKFEKLRQNRMVMGYFRYGSIKNNSKRYDNIGSTIERLKLYQETGNSEHLVDAANLFMVEFMQENHKNFHFEAADDGIHTKEITR